MGLLGDVYSAGDTLKRKLVDAAKNPKLTLEMLARRYAEDMAAQQNLQANAYPMTGDKTVLNSPEQIAQFRRELADQGANQAMQAATVWHGSPHKFNKFDASKIGTGEGSQTFGHGLYLAEAPEVSRQYAALAQKPGLKQGAAIGNDMGVLDGLIKLNARKYTDGDVTQLAELVKKRPAAFAKPDEMLSRISEYVDNNPPSYLYKVDLPDEHIAKMLDWDKPLSQQHPDVQKVLRAHGIGGSSAWDEITGHNLIAQLGQRIDPSNISVAASEALQKQGIPGIRYLDGGSRGAGAGTSNYVVFPGKEDILNIMERNGQPLDIMKDSTKMEPLFP